VVLYFYPKDETPGCTKETWAFKDDHEQFGKLQAEVIGVSSDPVESHAQFPENHSLPFTSLSDEGGKGAIRGAQHTFCALPRSDNVRHS
jgi:thioredoxin-dependent peroxiredoxin